MKNSFQVISPVDNSIYLERPYADTTAVEEALSKAENARLLWQKTPLSEKKVICMRAVDWLVEQKEKLGEEICWQMGRPIRYAASELLGLQERASYMISIADEALSDITCPEKAGFIRYIKRRPLGLCMVIAPWNYPFLTAVNAIIPALLAGNQVILKHSSQTPLVAERFMQAFVEAGLPAGVFQYLHLSHQATEKLIQSSAIKSVVFTGSVQGGARMEQAAAGRFIPMTLELGGKDAAYVRADAAVDKTVASLMDGAFFNAGQSCCGIKRIYVHQSRYAAFIDRARQEAAQYVPERPDNPESLMGPMVSSQAADAARMQLAEAIASGAEPVLAQPLSSFDQKGSAYFSPQILVNLRQDMPIMQEESFAPLLCIMPVQDDRMAIDYINDNPYGLTAAIYSQDMEAVQLIAADLEVGTVFMNRCDYLDPALAWTGAKQSGKGCSLSRLGFSALTRPQSFHLRIDF